MNGLLVRGEVADKGRIVADNGVDVFNGNGDTGSVFMERNEWDVRCEMIIEVWECLGRV